MRQWQVQEAKAKLSELLEAVVQRGPQEITYHGRSAAVVISRAQYDQMACSQESLVTFVQRSPLAGIEELDLSRSKVRSRRSVSL